MSSRPAPSSRRVAGVALALLLAGAGFAPLVRAQGTNTLSNSQLQSDFNGAIGAGQTAPVAAAPFSYPGTLSLTNITSITLTLTVIDGDTGLGPNGTVDTPFPPPGGTMSFGDDDFDVNALTLRLDGIETGLLLNGLDSFTDPLDGGDYITRTITATPTDPAALLLALQGDNQLVATIFDSTGDPNTNGFRVVSRPFGSGTESIQATLAITGSAVPEPGALALGAVALSLLGAGAAGRRRFGRQK